MSGIGAIGGGHAGRPRAAWGRLPVAATATFPAPAVPAARLRPRR